MSELATLCDLREGGVAGAANATTLPAVVATRAELPLRHGGLGTFILDHEGAKIAALSAATAGAGRMEDAIGRIGGWRPRPAVEQETFLEELRHGEATMDSKNGGLGWAFNLCRKITKFRMPGTKPPHRPDAPPGFDRFAARKAARTNAVVVAAHSAADNAVVDAAQIGNATSLPAICCEGWLTVVQPLKVWSSSLTGRKKALLKHMTSRTIKTPDGAEDIVVSQSLPDKYDELAASFTTSHNYQHQIAVFATARKTINYIFNLNVPACQRDTVEAFCRTLYGDSALRAIPSAKSFTLSSAAATSFHLRHVLHLPLQMPGLERFDTASDFMRDTTTTTHLSMRHDAARDAECRAALEVGALRALPEPGNIVNSVEDPTFELNLDGAVQLEKHGKTAFDISIHHFRSTLSIHDKVKSYGRGQRARRTAAAHALQVAAAALAAVSEDDARTGPLRDAVALARNRLSNAWSPGYEASCKAAGYAFFPITLNEFGGHSTSGLEWLRVIAHEGDGAMLGKNYDLGERFYHEHQTFVSMKSRSWIVQTVGVAIANATYAAARRIARFAAPLARNVFPTLDMYRTR